MPELITLVDTVGSVVGSAPRDRVRRENLRHASTAIVVRNSAGEIYLHRRADDKDWAPGFYDCAAGGLLRFGESPAPSAARELAEELGIDGAPLQPLGTSLYEDHSTRCFSYCYEAVWDGPVVHTDGEVSWGAWVSMAALNEHLAAPGWPFVPDTRRLLTRLVREDYRDFAALTVLA